MTTARARWITVDEMKDRLSISSNKAYEIAASGAIDTVKIGRSFRINEQSLFRWLESLTRPNAEGSGVVEEQ